MADFKKFKEKHETVIQFIKFSLISMLAGLTETISFLIMSYLLPARLPNQFDFFVFHYDTTGMFVAFFVSAILAEIVSFTINRKRRLTANNNVVKKCGYVLFNGACRNLPQDLDCRCVAARYAWRYGHKASYRLGAEARFNACCGGDNLPDEQVCNYEAHRRARKGKAEEK